MSGALVRGAFLGLLRLFYPQVAVRGAMPDGGAGCILVANHPNGLLDPLVVRVAVGRPVAFLAKSTLFTVPVLRGWLAAFDGIPVYRAKEGDTAQNERTFTLARARLDAGAWVALFPEGISHDAPRLAPLKTGVARIALGCEGPVRIVPVGIVYEAKETFRSRASATLGAPIDVAPFRAQASTDERAAVQALTERVADGLHAVMLEADDAELWNGFVTVASWLVDDADVGARDARARELAHAWKALSARDPAEAHAIADEARAFARSLEQLGVRDPLGLAEGRVVDPLRGAGRLLPLVPLAPLALLGALLGWAPYRIIRPVSERLAKGEIDVVGTYKLLLGVVVLPAWWLAQSLLIAWLVAWPAGLAALALAPLTGYVALRWDERLTARRDLLRTGWLAATQADVTRALTARRAALADRIARATLTASTP